MACIGNLRGLIGMQVNSANFVSANWSVNSVVKLYNAANETIADSGFIYISSEQIDSVTKRVYLKPIDDRCMVNTYIDNGSYLKKDGGTAVLTLGSVYSVTPNGGSTSLIIKASMEDDFFSSRHDIYNRLANGTINNANPFNSFLPNSIFSNVDLSWINADVRSTTAIHEHSYHFPLIVPITPRHGLLWGSYVPSSVRYVSSSGSESIRSILEHKTIKSAYSIAGYNLPSGMSDFAASNIKIVKFSSELPSFVSRVSFVENEDLFKKAISLPIYIITFTRKIASYSSSRYADQPFVCSENLPISNRMTGLDSTKDFINFMHTNERGHAVFAWDGHKSIFLGIITDNIINNNIDVVNGVWDGVVSGFNSQGNIATAISDSQNLLVSFFDGYQIGLSQNIENFNNVIKSGQVWQDYYAGEGLSILKSVFEFNNTLNPLIFENPSSGRKKFIQPLRY